MGKLLSIIGGTAAIVVGIGTLTAWWGSFIVLLKGGIPVVLLMGGLIALFAGISEIKDALTAKKEEPKEEKK